MRATFRHAGRRGDLTLSMAPMIDVIFLLLIFFVCTASFRPPEQSLPTQVSLPGSEPVETPPDDEFEDLDDLVVKVLWRDARAAWELNHRRYGALGEVRTVLEAAQRVQPGLPVILNVQPEVPMHHVIDLYDLCRLVGLTRVQFAASAE
ncbi:MAG: biopolymer transporter ExbD [Patescibacteria group bacterium]|nr:biopolymer transporter ExbD [Patescibacteria group bacterium]